MADATIKNIETITIKGAKDVTADVAGSNVTGLETISVLKSDNAEVHANSTTDVNVSGAKGTIDVAGGKNIVVNDATANKVITIGETATVDTVKPGTNATGTITVTDTKQGTADIITDGGTDVTINATISSTANAPVLGGDISVGETTAATGNVKITQNLNSDGGAAAAHKLTAADIVVDGGKTVDITVNATVTAKNAAAKGNIDVGTIDVTGDGKTTDVTVKQNSTVTEFVTPATAATAATQTVTFKALAKGESITLQTTALANLLTFTASKALTAAEVAAAFANLTDGDIQANGGKTANGIYKSGTTGGLEGGFTTGAVTSIDADNASVTFSTTDDIDAAAGIQGKAITSTTLAKATVAAQVPGKDPVLEAKTGNKVTYGDVTVDEDATAAASITTVTLDGFADADLGTTKALNALTTLNIANSAGTTTLETTKTALTLNVDNIAGTLAAVDLDNVAAAKNITTLTINATGEDSKFKLTADAVATLTIAAAADLDISHASTSLDALKTVTITGAGDVTLGDISGTLETLAASAATGAISATVAGTATVTTGAGDDKINLAAGTKALANTIDGGTGTNTIHMNSADANKATGATKSAAFEGKISNFQKLSLAKVLTTAKDTIDLANMDDISYVISAGTADTVETTVLTTVSNPTDAVTTGSISLVVSGVTYSVAANETVNSVLVVDTGKALDALAFKIAADDRVASVANNAGIITIVSNAGNALQVGTLTSTLDTTPLISIATNVATGSLLTLENMANDGTLELTGTGTSTNTAATGTVVTMKDALGNTDTFNIVTGDNAGNVGTVVVNSVEKINVTTKDIFTDDGVKNPGTSIADDGKDDSNSSSTLVVSADAAKTVNVSGAGDLVLDMTGNTAVTLIDASDMTGNLTVTAFNSGMTVIGGAGDDTLSVVGAKSGVVLTGGNGTDTFDVSLFNSLGIAGSAVTITDLTAGETIKFEDSATHFVSSKITLIAETTLTEYVSKAAEIADAAGTNSIAWFQLNNNTFVVQDLDDSGSFNTGDIIVKINGLVDLSTASFNATAGTLEIA